MDAFGAFTATVRSKIFLAVNPWPETNAAAVMTMKAVSVNIFAGDFIRFLLADAGEYTLSALIFNAATVLRGIRGHGTPRHSRPRYSAAFAARWRPRPLTMPGKMGFLAPYSNAVPRHEKGIPRNEIYASAHILRHPPLHCLVRKASP